LLHLDGEDRAGKLAVDADGPERLDRTGDGHGAGRLAQLRHRHLDRHDPLLGRGPRGGVVVAAAGDKGAGEHDRRHDEEGTAGGRHGSLHRRSRAGGTVTERLGGIRKTYAQPRAGVATPSRATLSNGVIRPETPRARRPYVPPRSIWRVFVKVARPGLAALALMAALVPPALAQGADSPEALGRRVLAGFEARRPAAFDSLVPDAEPREVVAMAAENDWPLRPGQAEVLSRAGDRAVLRITGVPVWGNTGDETIISRMFSGLYEAGRADGGWRLERRIPVDEANHRRAQALDVVIEPGRGLRVRDSLAIEVGGGNGWWAYLNHAVRLDTVRLDGRAADFR